MAAVRSSFTFLFLPLFLLTLSFSPTSLSNPEDDALLQFKRSLDPTVAGGPLASWAPSTSACAQPTWKGVLCNKNQVTGIHLDNMRLSGKIDVDALLRLSGLRTVALENNAFSGPIPPFNKLASLKTLVLNNNQFSGPIPPDYFANLGAIKKVWLSHNKFSGDIPNSLSKLKLLIELHLENNEFTGPIPPLSELMQDINLSNNKLQGPIPENLAKYGPNAFAGNQGLCGKPADNTCGEKKPPEGEPKADNNNNNNNNNNNGESQKKDGSSWVTMLIVVLAVIVVVLIILVVLRYAKNRKGEGMGKGAGPRGGKDEVVQVHVSGSTHSKTSRTSSKKSGDSRRGAAAVGKRSAMGDLVMVNMEKGTFGLSDLMKAAAEVLGNGGMGSAYKASMTDGLSVVVKRVREINKIGRDAFDAEMRRFGAFKHPNILHPLAYHYRKEEKLIVSLYVPKGSLLYVLHGDRGSSHSDLNWETRLKIVKGIAAGLSFLYSEFETYDLPHGNLKSSNILLDENYEPLLSDYAFHPLINPASAPQALFAFKSPDYVQYQQVTRKTDVYCLGIIILEILTGKFPSQYHSNGKGGTDVVQWVLTAVTEGREAELIDPEIKNNASTESLGHMLQLLQIGASCTEANPEQRLTLEDAIKRIEEVRESQA